MQRRDSWERSEELWSNDDELGRLVRWSLSASIGDAEPSPEVWCNILERVRNDPSPDSTRGSSQRSAAPLAAAVQATLIGCMVMTLGVGVRRDFVVARASGVPEVAPSVSKRVAETVRDDLPGSGLHRLAEDEHTFRLGGIIREATLPS
jgi:hypothetical protein